MFPHARLDSILTKIQRWNVVFGRIIPISFLFILAKVATIILSEFRAIFQNKMILGSIIYTVNSATGTLADHYKVHQMHKPSAHGPFSASTPVH